MISFLPTGPICVCSDQGHTGKQPPLFCPQALVSNLILFIHYYTHYYYYYLYQGYCAVNKYCDRSLVSNWYFTGPLCCLLPTTWSVVISFRASHVPFTAQPLSSVSTRGAVVTQECVEKLIRKDMLDPVTGDKLAEKDIILLQRVSSSILMSFKSDPTLAVLWKRLLSSLKACDAFITTHLCVMDYWINGLYGLFCYK